MAQKINISRRSFLFGGSAALAGVAASSFVGCVGPTDMSTTTAESGSMTAAVSYSATSFDPVGSYNVLALSASWHVFEGLYDVDRTTGEVYDAIADGDPQKVSDLVYDIKINGDKRFSDGNYVSLLDVKNTIAENMEDDNFSTFFDFIKSISNVNDYTIRIHLNYPIDVDIMKRRLSIARIHKHISSYTSQADAYIGSGPYVYKTLEGGHGGKIEFIPNGHYIGRNHPRAQKMIWNILEDGKARIKFLKENKSFVVQDVPVDEVENLKKAGYQVDINESMSMPAFIFNTATPPFNDVRVRQAVLYAVNDTELIKSQLNGYGAESHSFLPNNHHNFHETKNFYGFNPEKAKALLQEAKQEKLNFTLIVADSFGLEAFADEIEHNLSELGITCKISLQKVNLYEMFVEKQTDNFDAILNVIDPSMLGDDTDLLFSVIYGDNFINKKITEWPSAPNSRFDEMQKLLKTARESSGDAQKQAWGKAQDLISEEVPIYPILHRNIATAYNDKLIKDFKSINCSGIDMLSATPVRK